MLYGMCSNYCNIEFIAPAKADYDLLLSSLVSFIFLSALGALENTSLTVFPNNHIFESFYGQDGLQNLDNRKRASNC